MATFNGDHVPCEIERDLCDDARTGSYLSAITTEFEQGDELKHFNAGLNSIIAAVPSESTLYNRFKTNVTKALVDWTTDTIMVLLVDETYVYSPDHNFVDDVVSAEVSGTGYLRKTLATPTATQDDTLNRAVLDAADIVWTGLDAGTIGGAIIYQEVSDDSDSVLIGWLEASSAPVTSGSDFTVTFHATDGVFVLA